MTASSGNDKSLLIEAHLAELSKENKRLKKEIKKLRKMDREAASHVESLICLRTGFTGQEPYVGWKGLGLALKEHLDKIEGELAQLKNNQSVIDVGDVLALGKILLENFSRR